MSNLREGEVVQFSAFHDQAFMTFESNFFLWKEGVLDQRLWDTHTTALFELLGMPGMQEWWGNRQQWFSQEFRDFVNAKIGDEADRPMYWWAFKK